jgi:hypothetical protein
MFYFTPSPGPGFSACEPNFVNFPKSHSLRIIQNKRTTSFLAMATLAIFLPRLIVKWTYWLRHSGRLRVVTYAASTRRRGGELPCFVICPCRRRFPLESSNGTVPDNSRSACHTETDLLSR